MRIGTNAFRMVFLFMGLGLAIFMAMSAVRTGMIGHAITGLGMLLLGVVAFLEPAPLMQPFGRDFCNRLIRSMGNPSEATTILSSTGMALVFIGLGLRWAS